MISGVVIERMVKMGLSVSDLRDITLIPLNTIQNIMIGSCDDVTIGDIKVLECVLGKLINVTYDGDWV